MTITSYGTGAYRAAKPNEFVSTRAQFDDLQRQLRHEGCFDIVDFWWAPRLAGEFDGRLKYRLDNPSGRDIEDVLWQEKQLVRLAASILIVSTK